MCIRDSRKSPPHKNNKLNPHKPNKPTRKNKPRVEPPPPELVKTRLCKQFQQGRCRLRDCWFAHGTADLRPKPGGPVRKPASGAHHPNPNPSKHSSDQPPPTAGLLFGSAPEAAQPFSSLSLLTGSLPESQQVPSPTQESVSYTHLTLPTKRIV
eukprot:TRINITY_DN12803_c0_g1_i1.p1 TRINITY_DN12803_c0_g1~~TRINITY_DN12803_c0_g1_i1.p1  ORF type:complete len:154 (+),score=19.66 TRINITY_DN12803_c0_g1_i1:125-586(+)